jgi:hypothetical protein
MRNIDPGFKPKEQMKNFTTIKLRKRKGNKLLFGRMGKKFMRAKRQTESGMYGLAKRILKKKDEII